MAPIGTTLPTVPAALPFQREKRSLIQQLLTSHWLRIDVSFLAGNANVAFRFVFKSDFTVTAGIAVDDFEIFGAPPLRLLP